MGKIFENLINIKGTIVPVIPMFSDTSLSVNPKYENLPLSKQVEIIATMLKREDYNQVVILKEMLDNGLAILNVARMFKDEDVEVVAVCCMGASEMAYDTVMRNLKYGVGDGEKYLNDLLGSDHKKLH